MNDFNELLEKELSESIHQETVCRWLELNRIVYFAVPNGKWTSYSQAKKSKREGLKSGVPDILIIDKNANGQCTALEMKKYKGANHKLPCNCMSDDQKYWMDIFYQKGWTCILAHGSKEAIADLSKLYNKPIS